MPVNSRRAAPRLPPDGVGLVDGSTLPSGDRGFESISLQRRVMCEPDSSIRAPNNARFRAAFSARSAESRKARQQRANPQ